VVDAAVLPHSEKRTSQALAWGEELVVDELAAMTGENGWMAGKTCAFSLAFPGREPPNAAAVWGHPANDYGATITSRIDGPSTETDFGNH
jgi:hypothetical protein